MAHTQSGLFAKNGAANARWKCFVLEPVTGIIEVTLYLQWHSFILGI